MTTKKQKVKLGVFTVSSLGLLVAMAVGFLECSFDEKKRYYVVTPDAQGVEIGSAVEIRGVRVGRVSGVELYEADDESVTVTLEVDSNVRVNGGAAAYFPFRGVTGLRTVNIRGGDGAKEPLPPSSRIPWKETELEQLPDQATKLVARSLELMESAHDMMKNVERISGELDLSRVPHLMDKSDRLLTELTATTRQLEQVIAGTREPLRRTFGATEETIERVEEMSATADAVLVNMNRMIRQLEAAMRTNDEQVDATVRNLRLATENFRVLSRELRQRPNLLLFSDPPAERKLP
ncbi:MAG: MlaD family protein [Myxococcota bacterium]